MYIMRLKLKKYAAHYYSLNLEFCIKLSHLLILLLIFFNFLLWCPCLSGTSNIVSHSYDFFYLLAIGIKILIKRILQLLFHVLNHLRMFFKKCHFLKICDFSLAINLFYFWLIYLNINTYFLCTVLSVYKQFLVAIHETGNWNHKLTFRSIMHDHFAK